jgi:hypothetical protein
MNQPSDEGRELKARKGRAAKSPKLRDAKKKAKLSIYVSLESARRLGIHATMTSSDRSSIVDSLIREHLRDWVVQYRPAGKGGDLDAVEPQADAPEN